MVRIRSSEVFRGVWRGRLRSPVRKSPEISRAAKIGNVLAVKFGDLETFFENVRVFSFLADAVEVFRSG